METEETPTSKKKKREREKTRLEDRIKELFEQQLQSCMFKDLSVM
jgi:hypothetical protein